MSEAGSSNLRQPKATCRNHNRFTNLHAITVNTKNAKPEELPELYDAVQRWQIVEDMMELNGTFFPGCVYVAVLSPSETGRGRPRPPSSSS